MPCCLLIVWLISVLGLAAPCGLRDQPFLLMETGVSGGVALMRESVLLVLPTAEGGARVLLSQQRSGRTSYAQGTLDSYESLAGELSALGVYALPHPSPTSADLDPYGLKIAIHFHDGQGCYAYSPQRGCSLMSGPKAELTEDQHQTFQTVTDRLAALRKTATSPLQESEFRAAEQALWRGR